MNPGRADERATLVASGLIVGESLFGVAMAAAIVVSGEQAPIALVGDHFAAANVIGLVVFAGLIAGLYRWILRAAD